MATESLADRLRIHAACCRKAADESTDTVIDVHQLEALADDLKEAAEALAKWHSNPDGMALVPKEVHELSYCAALDYVNANCPSWVLYALHGDDVSSIHNVNASDEK